MTLDQLHNKLLVLSKSSEAKTHQRGQWANPAAEMSFNRGKEIAYAVAADLVVQMMREGTR